MYKEGKFIASPLRWGMVGGGLGSEIGYSHRDAAKRDGCFELVAGSFDLARERNIHSAKTLSVAKKRCYANYQSMFEQESNRADGIEVVTVATPNNTHYDICLAAMQHNIHVICEKPMTLTYEQALHLEEVSEQTEVKLFVMFGYNGYSMIEQARSMIADKTIGDVRIIHMEFAFGALAKEIANDIPRLKWRLSKKKSGNSYILNDVGIHGFQLGFLLTQLKPLRLASIKRSFVANRHPMEDDIHILMEMENNAVATLWASAVNIGSTHGFKIKVIGSEGSISWWDEYPNQLEIGTYNQPNQVFEQGAHYLNLSSHIHRYGAGAPEGFFDSWANLYRRFAYALRSESQAQKHEPMWYPNVKDGVLAVRFVNRAIESANNNGAWIVF